MIVLHCSGVGAQSAAPGPSRKCRPLVRAVVLYLWRHRAQSTMVLLFNFSLVTVGDGASQVDYPRDLASAKSDPA